MRHSIMTIILLVLAASTYANVASDILSSRTSDQQVQILGNIVNSAGLPCTPTQSFFKALIHLVPHIGISRVLMDALL